MDISYVERTISDMYICCGISNFQYEGVVHTFEIN